MAKEGIISLNHSGVVTSMNLSARQMFGYPPTGDAAATSLHASLPPPANLRFQDLLMEIDGDKDVVSGGE